ncbi:hypothetical protein MASR2M18_05450 [Ignavibacteria bacterium]
MLCVKYYVPNVIALALVLLLSGINPGRSKAEQPLKVKLEVSQRANICGNNQFILLVTSNEIYASDSLQGFEIDIRYNPDEIAFTNVIYNGTLAEQTDAKQYDYAKVKTFPKGQLYIQATKFNGYLKGKQPFVIITGKYNPKCKLTSAIYLQEFIPLYDFSAKRGDAQYELMLDTIAVKEPLPKNIIETKVYNKVRLSNKNQNDSVQFITNIWGSELRIDTLKYSIYLHDTTFAYILDSKAVVPLNYDIQAKQRNDTIDYVISSKSGIVESQILTSVRIQSKNITINDTLRSKISYLTTYIPACNCIGVLLDTIIDLEYYNAPMSVTENDELFYREQIPILYNFDIEVWLKDRQIEKTTFVSVLGYTYEYYTCNVSASIRDLPKGAYFITNGSQSVIAKYLQY